MEVATNICIGPLETRLHFQQILVNYKFKINKLYVPSCFVEKVFKKSINEFASEMAMSEYQCFNWTSFLIDER